jgi:hypothetical protein
VLVSLVSDGREPVRKFLWIRIPVTYRPKPAGIQVKHLNAKLSRVANHSPRHVFVHVHPAAPAIVHEQRIIRILPRLRIAQRRPHPPPQNVSGPILSIAKSTEKDDWGLKHLARLQPYAKRRRIRIQSEYPRQRILLSRESDTRPAAKLDAGVPPAVCRVVPFH